MTDRTLNLSLGISFALHALLLALYLFLMPKAMETTQAIVQDVDILVNKDSAAPDSPAAGGPMSTWNFLKMALPQVPARGGPAAPNLTARDIHMPEALVENTGRLAEARSSAMNVDLNEKTQSLAEATAKNLTARDAPSEGAANGALNLAEIGAKRAPSLPAGIKMGDGGGTGRYQPKGVSGIQALGTDTRRGGVAQAAALAPEAAGAPAGGGGTGRGSGVGFGPSISLQGAGMGGTGRGGRGKPMEAALTEPAVTRKREAGLKADGPAKPVELTGPLSNRKIITIKVPQFPGWARDQGILEATVAVRFFVSQDGKVLPEMRIERSSGYAQLDKEALAALKQWLFAPSETGNPREWGVVTFRFVLQ